MIGYKTSNGRSVRCKFLIEFGDTENVLDMGFFFFFLCSICFLTGNVVDNDVVPKLSRLGLNMIVEKGTKLLLL